MHEANRSSFMYEYNHEQGTSNSYSEYRVNNVSDRNYNLQYEHPVTSITGTNSSGSHPDEPKFRITTENGKKTSSVRQLEMEETEEYTDLEVRKLNGGRPRFVTEDRLESRLGVFAKEIQHEIKDGHTQLRNDFKDEICKLYTAIKGNYPNKNAGYRKQNDSPKFALKDTTCFTCQRKGHISKYCDFNKGRQESQNRDNIQYKGTDRIKSNLVSSEQEELN
ncbi:unnamed protein product [Mytilus coruscus]|uniref:CCHC-type domain-containing protein n=1 Tax=Mytilus coruscus TaxID=42192 RepID=A0A6J8ASM6_MYTCO|nr:unnamed protein product [Mytilus coruscus]